MEHIELGGSLPVPSVQELAKKPLTAVPERYNRGIQESPPITNSQIPLPEIPVIDVHKLLLPGDVELQKFDAACKEWGFFQVINHGVSSEVMEKMKMETERLFQLPMKEKKKLRQRDGDLNGFGQAFVLSEEQKLDWADLFYVITFPHDLRKPYLFSQLPQSFREAIEEYSKSVKNLETKILSSMAKALKMDEGEMRELFEMGMQSFRINYYPPCPQPELVSGFNQHSDAVGMTILLQVNETDGLQINKDGIWIPVHPLPNAFVVNVGDILEMVTNGIYRSIEHRAVVNSTKERVSIAGFHSPRLDRDMGPAPSLITPQTPAIFRNTGVTDYFKGLFSRRLVGRSYLDVFRINQ